MNQTISANHLACFLRLFLPNLAFFPYESSGLDCDVLALISLLPQNGTMCNPSYVQQFCTDLDVSGVLDQICHGQAPDKCSREIVCSN